MQLYDIVAQLFGLAGMTVNVLSFQRKSSRNIIFMQIFGSLLFCINYMMLGAYSGALLNLVAIFRAYVYSHREKCNAGHIGWFYGFCGAFALMYVLTFTVFGLKPSANNLLVELLPTAAMVLQTAGFRMNDANKVRVLCACSSPLWLVYNTVNFTLGGILCECFSICSNIIGLIRYRNMKEN